ncbi:MAG: C-GCAxxG-C-C family protein [Chloroflexi bacterium]|nr:C-GCAxxG-C-C family protein [Chloroflexota bacterium]
MNEKNNGEMPQDNGRRKFLIGTGLVVAAAATQFGLTGLLTGCKGKEVPSSDTAAATPTSTPQSPPPPWQYAKLDSLAAAERAYAAYYQGGCMFGAFEGIIGELREKVGPPYDSFPAAMMKYGKAGVVGWGTLCGALNGASASIYLVSEPKTGDGLIDELFAWYGAEALPNYQPKTPKFVIAPSKSESPLCHVSVTTWCETSGFKALSAERAERCAWLTASVVKHTTELLNGSSDGKVAVMLPLSTEVSGCLACHGKGGVVENVHASRASSCVSCHEPHSLPPK